MLYCRSCGQCSFISDNYFFEIRNTSGWEKVSVDPESGDTYDYLDSGTTESDHESYECPYCSGEDIEWESTKTNEEAVEHRNEYQEQMAIVSARQEETMKERALKKKAKDPNREWDVMENV